MPPVFQAIDPIYLMLAVGVGLFSGFVKGAVGFGMPMIMISGLGTFLPPDLALAALIIPTVLSNGWQAQRGGWMAARQAMGNHRLFLVILLAAIALSSQLVSVLAPDELLLIIGVPVLLFASSQLFGWQLRIKPRFRLMATVSMAGLAGFTGGLTGVWGPPTIAYLTALNTPKKQQIQIQGVIYGAGAVVLFFAHLKSGVMNGNGMALSMGMVAPALLGVWVGVRVQDRLNQEQFRRATLLVLVVAGLNLIRRAVIG